MAVFLRYPKDVRYTTEFTSYFPDWVVVLLIAMFWDAFLLSFASIAEDWGNCWGKAAHFKREIMGEFFGGSEERTFFPEGDLWMSASQGYRNVESSCMLSYFR